MLSKYQMICEPWFHGSSSPVRTLTEPPGVWTNFNLQWAQHHSAFLQTWRPLDAYPDSEYRWRSGWWDFVQLVFSFGISGNSTNGGKRFGGLSHLKICGSWTSSCTWHRRRPCGIGNQAFWRYHSKALNLSRRRVTGSIIKTNGEPVQDQKRATCTPLNATHSSKWEAACTRIPRTKKRLRLE